MKKKNRRFKIKRIMIGLVIILTFSLLFVYYRHLRVSNIYVIGNNILKEYEIIDLAQLKDYPYLHTVSKTKIVDLIKKNPLVNSVNVQKSLFGKITITIMENQVLYQDNDGKLVLSNKEKIFSDLPIVGIPSLLNDCDEVEDKLIDKLQLVDKDILTRISEILYQPSELDKERFMFYMSDGNSVYITLSKLNLINSYNEIYPTLEGKKGILYLDSGNHFEIKKENNAS